MLKINNLTVMADDKIILKDFNLEINKREIHTLMGLNGSGKSTLCKVLMGDENYKIINGTITFKDENLLVMDTTLRARKGLYIINQTPIEIEGVKNSEMLKLALEARTGEKINIFEFSRIMNNVCEKLNIDKNFIHRGINENMSGGERKKNELMHLYVLKPDFIILDEIDSGVDIDNLNTIIDSLKEYFIENDCSMLIITHNTNLVDKINSKYVHVLSEGKIIKTGTKTLAEIIEKEGFNRTNKVSENN